MAACNNANSVVYTITDIEIDMTSPDVGDVYEHDVCYFSVTVSIDDPSVSNGGFTYIWSGGTQQSESNTASVYAAKFTKGQHVVTCSVVGNDQAVQGTCSMIGWLDVTSKPYKLNYVCNSHTITSPTVSNQTVLGHEGTSTTDSSKSVTAISLEGTLPIEVDYVTPILTMTGTFLFLGVENNEHTIESRTCPSTARGTYQPNVSESDRDTVITMETIDTSTTVSEYIETSELIAETGPNNVGGAGSMLSEVTNPTL